MSSSSSIGFSSSSTEIRSSSSSSSSSTEIRSSSSSSSSSTEIRSSSGSSSSLSSSSSNSSSSSTEIRSSSSSSSSLSSSSSNSSSSSTEIRSSSSSGSSSTEIRSSSSSTEIRSSSSSSSSSTEIRSSSSSISSSSSFSSSSSSSSSTEIMSSSISSSSSSSYLDNHDNKTIPFIFETESITPVWSMVSYGEYIFAGTGPNGVLLRSKDRFSWEQIYSVNDTNIKSLFIQNNTLFIGTSPNGMIYMMNLDTGNITLSQQIGGSVFGFIYYNNTLYASGGIPNQIWKYNAVKNRWDSIYRVPATITSKMLIYNGKMYIISNSSNIISFDGAIWKLESTGIDNTSSIRSVSTEPFSHISNNIITRSSIKDVTLSDMFENEEVYDIYPMNCSDGLNSADIDGDSLIVGSSNYSKIYNFINGVFYPTFQTEQANTIHYLLNLDVGVNLASVDNKLYLIYDGELPTFTTTTTTLATTTTTTTPSIVTLIYPKGGENLVVGTTITIQWNSITSINDSVKIELYKGNIVSLVINPNTPNDGSYDWDIPSSLLPGEDYNIVITWLSASSEQPKTNESGIFGIWYVPISTTTTTTTLLNPNLPQTKNSRGIPLIEFANNEYITFMIKDIVKGGILFATSNGRIIGCEDAVVNAYLTGDRSVYAEVKNGFGNISDTYWTTFFYGLYNKIAEINEQKEIIKYKFEVKPSAILTDRITGVFLSPILSVKEDLDFWKQIIWKEDKPDNTEIIVCVRAADSPELLTALSWDYCFISNDSDRTYNYNGFITRDLSSYQIKGKYLQFKVTMTTDSKNISPSIVNLSITYSTQFATYFFTTKFSLQNKSNVQSGLLVANMTQPQNTEIRFGIAGNNSSDWNDYSVIETNKLFSLSNLERMKVGIKMISYDENIPEVAEFSLFSGSELNNNINEI